MTIALTIQILCAVFEIALLAGIARTEEGVFVKTVLSITVLATVIPAFIAAGMVV